MQWLKVRTELLKRAFRAFSNKKLKLKENEIFIMSNNNVLAQELLSPMKI